MTTTELPDLDKNGTLSTTMYSVAQVVTNEYNAIADLDNLGSVRDPPDHIHPNNIIIICVGASILFIPVFCFIIWVCKRQKMIGNVQELVKRRLNGKLPYSSELIELLCGLCKHRL